MALIFVTLFLWTGNSGSFIKDVPADVCKKIACEFARRNTCPPAQCDEDGNVVMWSAPQTYGSTMLIRFSHTGARC